MTENPVESSETFGWRCWRVVEAGSEVLLRNPWTNSGQLYTWLPGQEQVADCFWAQTRVPGTNGPCLERVSPSCSCGIRSMSSLPHLAAFLASNHQLDRHPLKATVVGQVAISGRVQRRVPGLPPRAGYQRSQYASLVGPLYVSPLGRTHLDGLRRTYEPAVRIVAPDAVASGQQEWLDALAAARVHGQRS